MRRARPAVRLLPWPAALAAVAAACGGRPAPAVGATALLDAEPLANGVVAAALEADARFTDPDSLYASDATVVADGRPVFTYPRFAAVDSAGQVAITSSRIDVHAGVAWADVDYRWMADDGTLVRQARATFVLAPRPDRRGWVIVHAHSSEALPGADAAPDE